MAKDLVILMGVGTFLIFVGFLQIQNVRRALKTGTIALGIKDPSRIKAVNRADNPVAYHLNFWPCLFAAITLPILGAGAIGFGLIAVLNL